MRKRSAGDRPLRSRCCPRAGFELPHNKPLQLTGRGFCQAKRGRPDGRPVQSAALSWLTCGRPPGETPLQLGRPAAERRSVIRLKQSVSPPGTSSRTHLLGSRRWSPATQPSLLRAAGRSALRRRTSRFQAAEENLRTNTVYSGRSVRGRRLRPGLEVHAPPVRGHSILGASFARPAATCRLLERRTARRRLLVIGWPPAGK